MAKYILTVPLIMVLIIIVSLVLLTKGLWVWAMCLVISVICINSFSQTFALSIPLHHTRIKSDFRVLTYNVNRAYDFSANGGTIQELISHIRNQEADVVLLQEYNVNLYPEVQKGLSDFYTFQLGTEEGSRFKSVFSKYPIENYEMLWVDADDMRFRLFKNSFYNQSRNDGRVVLPICSMRIDINGFKIRLLNCHFMSNNYSVEIRNYKEKKTSLLRAITLILKRIEFGYAIRKLQSEIVCNHLSTCREKNVIICGDFNDVSGSPTLCSFHDMGMEDAWWRGGFGFGFTYHGLGMLLRLDHILYSVNSLILRHVSVSHSACSDHDLLVADFELSHTNH